MSRLHFGMLCCTRGAQHNRSITNPRNVLCSIATAQERGIPPLAARFFTD
jgi:hypothetical protein